MMIRPFTKTKLFAMACALACGVAASAAGQFDSENVVLRSNISVGTFGSSSGNDCWGYVSPSGREYALMGLSNKVAFVEITDPDNPDWFASVPHGSTTWCDVKTYQDFCYIVTEGSGTGVQVVDMSDIDNHNISHVNTLTNPDTSHNVAIDEVSGFLYTTGSRGGSDFTVIYDLSNKSNPTMVGTWGTYEHDMEVVTFTSGPNAGRQIMFGASEGRGLDIVDVTNKANPVLLSRLPYSNVSYAHQVWVDADAQYAYLNDELDSINRTSVFDVSDLNNPVHVTDFASGTGSTDHNEYIRDGYLFQADYTSGLRIHDLNQSPLAPPQIGFFDTHPETDAGGFDGAWSCYPYFPSGMVIISDSNRGLFVVDPSDALGGRLGFDYPNGRPEFISPDGGTTMRVDVIPGPDVDPEPGSGTLHVDTGNGFQAVLMNDLGGNSYEAVFPSSPCGTLVRWYVSAETTDQEVQNDPGNAPNSWYNALAASGLDIAFEDDFEADQGWTVEDIDLDTGSWDRGVPAGNGSRGDPTSDADGSGSCYVTGNTQDEDVDGGPTRLLSPTIDLSGAGEPQLTYSVWFSNDDQDGDSLEVEISNNDGATWTLVESVSTPTAGWEPRAFNVSDFVTPTNQMRVRFSASDNPNDSVTEAGVDAFGFSQPACDGGTELTAVDVVTGTILDGGLDEIRASDDTYLHTRSGFGNTFIDLHHTDFRISATTTVGNPSTIDLTFEERIDEPAGSGAVSLWNYNTNTFDSVGAFGLGSTDTVHQVNGIAATDYVDGGGGIIVQIKHRVFVNFVAFTFESWLDEVRIDVN